MVGRFLFYRRRRILPFAAIACLVCINAATLQPFTLSPELLGGFAAASAKALANDCVNGPPSRLHCERTACEEPASVGVAGPPPIVKNLRRPAPSRSVRAAVRGPHQIPAHFTVLATGWTRPAVTANAIDLSRLCRLLI